MKLLLTNNIQNNFEYNKFITQNATKIINEYKNKIEKLYKCGPHGNTMLNEQYKQHCNKDLCEVKPYDNKRFRYGKRI